MVCWGGGGLGVGWPFLCGPVFASYKLRTKISVEHMEQVSCDYIQLNIPAQEICSKLYLLTVLPEPLKNLVSYFSILTKILSMSTNMRS